MTIKLIGAGFGRTGTTSVKAAYEMLGLGRCYHMLEVIRDQTAVQQWIDATEGKIDWEEIFKGFTATVDWPGAHFWRELIGYYPDAKVLLTVRDSEAWFASTQRTIFQMAKLQKSGAPPAGPDGLLPTNAFKMFEKTVAADIDGELDDKAACMASFERRNAEVKRTVPPGKLLVYDVTEGWGPLCAFLGVPVPDKPFPKENTSKEFAGHRGAPSPAR